MPIVRELQASGVKSRAALAAALNARKVPTARGGSWSHVQVGVDLGKGLSKFRWLTNGCPWDAASAFASCGHGRCNGLVSFVPRVDISSYEPFNGRFWRGQDRMQRGERFRPEIFQRGFAPLIV